MREAASKHWRQLAWAWAFPFFLVFVYAPLDRWFRPYHWLLWTVVCLPAFFWCFWIASGPVRTRQISWWQDFILVGLPFFPLLLFAIALSDLLISRN